MMLFNYVRDEPSNLLACPNLFPLSWGGQGWYAHQDLSKANHPKTQWNSHFINKDGWPSATSASNDGGEPGQRWLASLMFKCDMCWERLKSRAALRIIKTEIPKDCHWQRRWKGSGDSWCYFRNSLWICNNFEIRKNIDIDSWSELWWCTSVIQAHRRLRQDSSSRPV